MAEPRCCSVTYRGKQRLYVPLVTKFSFFDALLLC